MKYVIIDIMVGEKVERDSENAFLSNLWDRLEEYGKNAYSYRDVEDRENWTLIIERA